MPFRNPSAGRATVRFSPPEPTRTGLTVREVLGREVLRLLVGHAEAGRHEVAIDAGRAGIRADTARLCGRLTHRPRGVRYSVPYRTLSARRPPMRLLLAQADPTGGFGMFLPLVLIFIVFYFFMIRPQARRDKERRAMVEAVKKGDRIVTVGGVHGTVVQVDEASLLVQVDQNVKLRFEKNAVASVAS